MDANSLVGFKKAITHADGEKNKGRLVCNEEIYPPKWKPAAVSVPLHACLVITFCPMQRLHIFLY